MKRILVVDDDRSVLQLLARVLKGYDLTIARGGREALAMVDRHASVDLLITDYLMPEMTGEELIARMREHRPQLKVLVITGHGDLLNRESPPWWRAEAHLTKPFRIQALREAVAALIEER